MSSLPHGGIGCNARMKSTNSMISLDIGFPFFIIVMSGCGGGGVGLGVGLGFLIGYPFGFVVDSMLQ